MVDSTPILLSRILLPYYYGSYYSPYIADMFPITAITVILWHMEGETGPAPFPQDGPAVHHQQQDHLQEGTPTIRPLRLQEHQPGTSTSVAASRRSAATGNHPRAASGQVMEEYHRILQSRTESSATQSRRPAASQPEYNSVNRSYHRTIPIPG